MINNGRSRKLPFDPVEAVAHLKAADPKLGALIDRAGPFALRLDPAPSPFESLLESIIYQQLPPLRHRPRQPDRRHARPAPSEPRSESPRTPRAASTP